MTSWMRTFRFVPRPCHYHTEFSCVRWSQEDKEDTSGRAFVFEVHLEVIVGSNSQGEAHRRLADLGAERPDLAVRPISFWSLG